MAVLRSAINAIRESKKNVLSGIVNIGKGKLRREGIIDPIIHICKMPVGVMREASFSPEGQGYLWENPEYHYDPADFNSAKWTEWLDAFVDYLKIEIKQFTAYATSAEWMEKFEPVAMDAINNLDIYGSDAEENEFAAEIVNLGIDIPAFTEKYMNDEKYLRYSYLEGDFLTSFTEEGIVVSFFNYGDEEMQADLPNTGYLKVKNKTAYFYQFLPRLTLQDFVYLNKKLGDVGAVLDGKSILRDFSRIKDWKRQRTISLNLSVQIDGSAVVWIMNKDISDILDKGVRSTLSTSSIMEQGVSADDVAGALAFQKYKEIPISKGVFKSEAGSFGFGLLAEYDGEEWAIMNGLDAKAAARANLQQSIDNMGLAAFGTDYQQYILNNFIEKGAFRDVYENKENSYVNDIENESSGVYENRLIAELYESDLIDQNDLAEDAETGKLTLLPGKDLNDLKDAYATYLVNQKGDLAVAYKDEFGTEEFEVFVKSNNMVDWDSVIEDAIDKDGVGYFIATYDGEEVELGGNWYAYRLN